MVDSPSSSGFIVPADFSSEWRDISLLQTRSRTQIYTASWYGRRFVLKALTPDTASLTDYRLQQEQEFQLGIQLVHPNIAATYSLEEIDGVGRCIVQEWIDGLTLGEWLRPKPTKAARKRVFSQLLDALEYIHSLQLVHHDLKPDNILITRNGANVKLIDFGLSATDATITPVPNDPRKDIEALQRLFPDICPKGHFANVAALRKVLNRRNRLMFLLPVLLSALLLGAAAALLYISWHERQSEQQRIDELNAQIAAYEERERAQLEKQKRNEAMCAQMDSILAQERARLSERQKEQRRYDDMCALADEYIALERSQIMALLDRPVSFDRREIEDVNAYAAYFKEFIDLRERQFRMRDSLIATFPENDPLREQFSQRWYHLDLLLFNELSPKFNEKLH